MAHEMTFEEKILRNDTRVNYTEHDIKEHLKFGVWVYESFDDFCGENAMTENDARYDWEKLNRSIVDGKEYRYDVAL